MVPPNFHLLLLLLLGVVSSDRLRYHLDHLVDRDISACDNFFHHVCSQKVDPSEFFIKRVAKLFQNTTEKLRPDAVRSSPIEYDLEDDSDVSSQHNNYEKIARDRCKNDVSCYEQEQAHFGEYMTRLELEFNITTISPNDTVEESIQNLIMDTSATIDKLSTILNSDRKNDIANEAVKFFTSLQSRIPMIELMKANASLSDFYEIEKFTGPMKERMVQYVKQSTWLANNTSFYDKIMERVENIQFYHDFDKLDLDGTTLRRLNRDLNELYFHQTRKTGIRNLDTLMNLNDAYNKLLNSSSLEVQNVMYRIGDNFSFGAFFIDETKWLTVKAPTIYRPVVHTDILKEPFIALSCIGHEMYHSLFSPGSTIPLSTFAQIDCIIDHYNKTCLEFDDNPCKTNRNQTIYEDAPDLEGIRLAYSLFNELYSAEQQKLLIDGTKTTFEQAFFYYISSAYCQNEDERYYIVEKDDEHSPNLIRVNGGLSLMPEFSEAFNCKKGDRMFVERKDSCYVLGPNS